jgi:deoxyhypusine synthase
MGKVNDINLKPGGSVKKLVKDLGTTGFQASNLQKSADIIQRMKSANARIFLSFTANMMASGLRGTLTQLVSEGFADAVITTGGSIDHDIIRDSKPYLLGDFNVDDIGLHKKGVNRIGNILVPNDRYAYLEKQMAKMFTGLHKQKEVFTPSELNAFIGAKLSEKSFLNTCYRNGVPVFCPGMIDSAIGMHLFFYRQKNPDFIMNTAEDLKNLSDLVFEAKKTGGIILGGGISKHHLIGANLMRGGLDYAVYVTTAAEYDGSLSGARPREAKSWGKIREKSQTSTVYADASIALPLITACLIDN